MYIPRQFALSDQETEAAFAAIQTPIGASRHQRLPAFPRSAAGTMPA